MSVGEVANNFRLYVLADKLQSLKTLPESHHDAVANSAATRDFPLMLNGGVFINACVWYSSESFNSFNI